jgi:hypothetical protein
MSILKIGARPFVNFDPSDKDHRRQYAAFLKDNNWRSSPVQFYIESGWGDLVSMIEHKISRHFLSKEFGIDLPDRSESWVGKK